MKKILLLFVIVAAAACTGCSKEEDNERDKSDEYQISFDTYNTFNLGEQKDIAFSSPQNTPTGRQMNTFHQLLQIQNTHKRLVFTGGDAGNVRAAIKNSQTLYYSAIKLF